MGLSIEAYYIADIVDGNVNYFNMMASDDEELLKTISIMHENAVLINITNTKYLGGMPCPAHLTLPATYRGSPILAIYGNLAYRGDNGECDWLEKNYDILSVTIPEGVAIVDPTLCSDCPNLKTINYPRSLIKR